MAFAAPQPGFRPGRCVVYRLGRSLWEWRLEGLEGSLGAVEIEILKG